MSSPRFRGQNHWISFHRCETGYWTFEDIWLSSLHSCAWEKEDKVEAFRIERNLCWVQWEFKSISSIYYGASSYWYQQIYDFWWGDIMLMLHKMMHQFRRELENIHPVMNNVLISALTGTTTHRRNVCIFYSGAYKNMTSLKKYLSNLIEEDSPHKVKLGDD